MVMNCPSCGARTEVVRGKTGRGFSIFVLACVRPTCKLRKGFRAKQVPTDEQTYKRLSREADKEYTKSSREQANS